MQSQPAANTFSSCAFLANPAKVSAVPVRIDTAAPAAIVHGDGGGGDDELASLSPLSVQSGRLPNEGLSAHDLQPQQQHKAENCGSGGDDRGADDDNNRQRRGRSRSRSSSNRSRSRSRSRSSRGKRRRSDRRRRRRGKYRRHRTKRSSNRKYHSSSSSSSASGSGSGSTSEHSKSAASGDETEVSDAERNHRMRDKFARDDLIDRLDEMQAEKRTFTQNDNKKDHRRLRRRELEIRYYHLLNKLRAEDFIASREDSIMIMCDLVTSVTGVLGLEDCLGGVGDEIEGMITDGRFRSSFKTMYHRDGNGPMTNPKWNIITPILRVFTKALARKGAPKVLRSLRSKQQQQQQPVNPANPSTTTTTAQQQPANADAATQFGSRAEYMAEYHRRVKGWKAYAAENLPEMPAPVPTTRAAAATSSVQQQSDNKEEGGVAAAAASAAADLVPPASAVPTTASGRPKLQAMCSSTANSMTDQLSNVAVPFIQGVIKNEQRQQRLVVQRSKRATDMAQQVLNSASVEVDE